MIGALSPNAQLLIRDTDTAKGRGVFALRDYVAGETVETSAVLELSLTWDELPPELQRMVYDWRYLVDDPQATAHAIALGVGSLFNHSSDPNLRYEADPANRTLVFTAMRDIAGGEELVIDYNDDIDPNSGQDWFQSVGIAPLA